MQFRPPVPPPYPGGFSLLTLAQVLLRRKWWILLTFLAVVAAGFVYLNGLSPAYESRVRLRIGQVAGNGPFEGADVLSSRLLARYGESVADGVRRERPVLTRATVHRTVPGVIDLVSQGDAPQDASMLLERIYEEIRTTHAAVHEQGVRYLKEQLQSIERQQEALSKQYQETSALMDRVKGDNPVQASLLAIERGRITESMTRLAAEKPAIGEKLAPPKTQPTELLGEITAPEAPFFPRKALILSLAMVLGGIFGVLIAFAVELLAHVRRAPGAPRHA